ncbi:hypothetical protein [Rhizobium sp. RCAM05973]|uniref:hypothetical protein n=1 Tax=Rhizobium sp. RCAM05973 TaxID=2994066 RepID=UPI0022EBD41F|nr:hypothetical protein [Rhizobium sp. RCAM05973]
MLAKRRHVGLIAADAIQCFGEENGKHTALRVPYKLLDTGRSIVLEPDTLFHTPAYAAAN